MIDVIDREPVRLRSKSTQGGESLYLDINVKGYKRKEFLNLYILRGTSEAIRSHNRKVIRIANDIRIQRLADIYNMNDEIPPHEVTQVNQIKHYLWVCMKMPLHVNKNNVN